MTPHKILVEFLAGWQDFRTMCEVYARGTSPPYFTLANSYNEEIDFWDGLSMWWVEEHVRSEPRRIAKELESAFGPAPILSSEWFNFGASPAIAYPDPNPAATITLSSLGGTLSPPPYSRDEFIAASTPFKNELCAGFWKVPNCTVQIRVMKKPHPLRRFFVQLFLGLEWQDRITRPTFLLTLQTKVAQAAYIAPPSLTHPQQGT